VFGADAEVRRGAGYTQKKSLHRAATPLTFGGHEPAVSLHHPEKELIMRPVVLTLWSLTLLGLLLVTPAPAQEQPLPKPTGESIVSPDAKLELLYTRSAPIQGGLTEGPAVAPDGSIYFSDIPFGKDKGLIVRFDPKTKKTTVFTDDSGKSNGLIFDADGNLLACEGSDFGGRRVSKWNVKTKERTTVADKYNGKKFNACNDICLDSQGRIYFTDPRYLGEEPRELKYRAVYRIDTDGSVHEVTHDTVKPNGIAISPDGKTLYVANHDNGTDQIDPSAAPPKQGVMNIEAYPLRPDGSVGKGRVLVDFGDAHGCDGMTVDEKGHVYLTVRDAKRPGVMVIDSEGKEVAFIPTGPANQKSSDPKKPAVGIPSNVEFGIGEEINMLYVTVDKSLFRIPLKVKGFHVQFAKRN
jgi:gluconolactonase